MSKTGEQGMINLKRKKGQTVSQRSGRTPLVPCLKKHIDS